MTMLLRLEEMFNRGADFETAIREARIQTRDGLRTARIFWGVLERIAEFGEPPRR
jgi:hypothetical protein